MRFYASLIVGLTLVIEFVAVLARAELMSTGKRDGVEVSADDGTGVFMSGIAQRGGMSGEEGKEGREDEEECC